MRIKLLNKTNPIFFTRTKSPSIRFCL